MKTRPPDQHPPLDAPTYGKSLRGLGFNLIVRNIGQSLRFHEQVLQSTVFYSDEDFAMLRLIGADYMLHADHAYSHSPVSGLIAGVDARGIGIELRIYGLDPDGAAQRARDAGFTVLAGAMDKPHGLREAMLIDGDGYLWIPSIHLNG
jgi:uncharacterized glyoxalase superfamily protein PhnB